MSGFQESQTTFSVLEPVRGEPLPDVSDPLVSADLGFNVSNNRLDDTIAYSKEFYIPAVCTDVIFLRLSIAIVCPLSFEILDLETLATGSIPIKTEHFKSIIKQYKPKKALGLFRAFGLIVDAHGTPVSEEESVIDWHGVVHTVTAVAPYFVLFKSNSIEVRDGTTGRLEQVMFGTGVRCTWRGPGVLQGELDEDHLIPESVHERSRLQVLMNAPPIRGSDEIAQHVFDLVRK
ncbi:hypothetical protein Clacol_006420 [Clathrus columnatus]|uniref:CNH domain-containing protein n=1 Tax=Clathrus columnatus TaxID=1419009 RepID=A0AAV5AC14_9AGAM|nr:hypothetical protein Clacol_006420 [Clathrus columnatus]